VDMLVAAAAGTWRAFRSPVANERALMSNMKDLSFAKHEREGRDVEHGGPFVRETRTRGP
jgi:hypothetical protein